MKRLRPTFKNNPQLFNLFFIAETLGKTVDELLLGEPRPLSNIEAAYWPAYSVIKSEFQESANKKSNSAAANGPRMKKTMG